MAGLRDTDGAKDGRNSCLNCIFFISWADLYEDPREDNDGGKCQLAEYKDTDESIGDGRICNEHDKISDMTQVQEKTDREYQGEIAICRSLFEAKTSDYGTAWRILRLPSITDQIWIKAKRIRTIQETGAQKVEDSIRSEFIGIVNYSIIALIQQQAVEGTTPMSMSFDVTMTAYDNVVKEIIDLHHAKNNDYGEAWRDMRISSITDIILQKLLRVKQIEDNYGNTSVSEGVRANYQDIVNYSVFCLIKMK